MAHQAPRLTKATAMSQSRAHVKDALYRSVQGRDALAPRIAGQGVEAQASPARGRVAMTRSAKLSRLADGYRGDAVERGAP